MDSEQIAAMWLESFTSYLRSYRKVCQAGKGFLFCVLTMFAVPSFPRIVYEPKQVIKSWNLHLPKFSSCVKIVTYMLGFFNLSVRIIIAFTYTSWRCSEYSTCINSCSSHPFWGWYYVYAHFTEERTEAQVDLPKVTQLISKRWDSSHGHSGSWHRP